MNLSRKQRRYWESQTRYNVIPAGRRSGKSEIAKRRLVKKALSHSKYPDAWFIAGAPTRAQARRLFWNDLKKLVPSWAVGGRISESELSIPLINGAKIQVIGLEVAQRVEGTPIVHALLDECADIRPEVWPMHLRPSLSDRQGTVDFTGVPEGRNWLYDLFIDAQSLDDWTAITWTSEEVLPLYLGEEEAKKELASARATLDELTYDQEYRASFVTFQGRAYYNFSLEHNIGSWKYEPSAPLFLCFDFNVEPGVAVVIQEFNGNSVVIDEIYIPRNSNTEIVGRAVVERYGQHPGEIFVYGDATGGARGTAKIAGSDWDILKRILPSKSRWRVPKSNPKEKSRVNAMNSRLKTADGLRHLYVNSSCVNTIKDFEGVEFLKGSAGEIDKKGDPRLTHITDAIGYYVAKKYPIVKKKASIASI